MGKVNETQLVTGIFCFETSLSLTNEIFSIRTLSIISKEIKVLIEPQTVEAGSTGRLTRRPNKVPKSCKAADPKPTSLSPQISAPSPPVVGDAVLLEEDQLTSDKVKLQLRRDLH